MPRNKYKVLRPLPIVRIKLLHEQLDYNAPGLVYTDIVETKPRFFRDGTYFDRDTQEAWVEHKGRAFSIPKSEFKHQYDIVNAPPISIETYIALRYTHGLSKYINHNAFNQDCLSNSFTRPVFRYQLQKLNKLGWY